MIRRFPLIVHVGTGNGEIIPQHKKDQLVRITPLISIKIERVKKAILNCDAATVKDHEGNIYNVVAFENTPDFTKSNPDYYLNLTQCWTKENMRAVTSPSTGSYLIVTQAPSDDKASMISKVASWTYNDSVNRAPRNFGVLYNWNAALDIYIRCSTCTETYPGTENINSYRPFVFTRNLRGVCPRGWHVSRSEEWTSIEVPYANATYQDLENYTNTMHGARENFDNLGSKFVTGLWNNNCSVCEIGDNTCSSRNLSDLSVLPAGMNIDITTMNDTWTYFWTGSKTSSPTGYIYASYIEFHYQEGGPNHDYGQKFNPASVRCVKDYDDSYTKPARVIYYYKNTNNQFAGLGIETNPDPNKEILYRGVLYGSQSQSQDLYFDSNLSLPDGAKYKIQYPASDTIMEIQWGSTSEHPSLGTLFRPVFIYTDGTVDYGLDWIYSNN